MERLTIDFETEFFTDRSLTNLTYYEYVNSGIRPICMAYRLNGKGKVLTTQKEIVSFFRTRVNPETTLLCAHNALFDSLVLKHFYDIEFENNFCTLMGANVLMNHADHDLDSVATILGWKGANKKVFKDILKEIKNNEKESIPDWILETLYQYADNDVAMGDFIAERMLTLLEDQPQELQSIDMYIKRHLHPSFVLDTKLCKEGLSMAEAELEDAVIRASKIIRSLLGGKEITIPKFPALIRKDAKKQLSTIVPELEPVDIEKLFKKINDTITITGSTPAYTKAILSSAQKFAAVFDHIMSSDCPVKKNPKGQLIPAVSGGDVEFVTLRADPLLRPLVDARILCASNLVRSRLQRFLSVAESCNGRIPNAVMHHAAHPGRPGSGNKLNLMNMPRISANKWVAANAIRLSLRAPPNYTLIIADYSNIEPRLAHWLADQDFMMDVFKRGGDIYAELASRVTEKLITKETHPELRNKYKVVAISCNYQTGPQKYKDTMAQGVMGAEPEFITLDEARTVIYDEFRPNNPGIVNLWKTLESFLPHMVDENQHVPLTGPHGLEFGYKYIQLPSKRKMSYPGLQYKDPEYEGERGGYYYGVKHGAVINLYGGKMLENIVQAMARDIHLEHMLKINEWCVNTGWGHIVADTYDEITVAVPTDLVPSVRMKINHIMTQSPRWCEDVPIAVEIGTDERYSK